MSNWRQDFTQWLRERIPDIPAVCLHIQERGAAAAAATAFALAHRAPALIITCDQSAAEQLGEALANYSSLLECAWQACTIPEVKGLRREWVPQNEAARCAALDAALSGTPALFVTSVAGALAPAVEPSLFRQSTFTLKPGDHVLPPEELARQLTSLDYDNEIEVHQPGEFSRRGGIVDVYSPLCEAPVRIEYFGNQIDTLRLFDPETQCSYEHIDQVRIVPRGEMALVAADQDACTLLDYFNPDCPLVVVDQEAAEEHLESYAEPEVSEAWRKFAERNGHRLSRIEVSIEDNADHALPDQPCRPLGVYPADSLAFPTMPEQGVDAAALHWQLLTERLLQWNGEQYRVVACCGNEGEAKRFSEMLAADNRLRKLPVTIEAKALDHGIVAPEAQIVLLSEHELFGKRQETRRTKARYRAVYDADRELDLEEGGFAVHAAHGICLYHGLRVIEVAGAFQETLELEFDEGQRLFVPLDQSHLVSAYIGGTRKLPKLSRLGGAAWKNSRAAAASSAFDLAAELLRLEAVRKHTRGMPHHREAAWEDGFARSFPYAETEDQQAAIDAVLADMACPKPMDRLLCGDVGYGKTEVAVRAAFRAVMNGRQVAVLVPTTILAQQHYITFRDRMAEYPVTIEMLSRFRSQREQRAILEKLSQGQVDILIGTHRLLQNDVHFDNLGLLVIDEEQRFGVTHKEKLKRLRSSVDILTMTATPIPRTLYFSLSGIRNLSTIMTPPAERLPVKTVISQYDKELIREAIQRELERRGQVFFLHNRVETIGGVCRQLRELVPEARFAEAHGQMRPHDLEKVMLRYLDREIDVLVCTTIIESGLDIPNANTIIIDHADRFGLAELHQLRGRVGRYHHQAYAYLLLPPMGTLPRNAKERLAAIRRYTHLGAGFRLALRDLEIRGAGNILGSEQSGHIAAVGFDLYCQLLEQAVAQLGKQPLPRPAEVPITMDQLSFGLERSDEVTFAACLPPDYIEAEPTRLDCYRRIARCRNRAQLQKLRRELKDRFGPLPLQAEVYLKLAGVRLAAAERGIQTVAVRDRKLILTAADGLVKTPDRRIPVLTADSAPEQVDELLAFLQHLPATQ